MSSTTKREHWNQCDYCGRFISYRDFARDEAVRQHFLDFFGNEQYYTFCKDHRFLKGVIKPL